MLFNKLIVMSNFDLNALVNSIERAKRADPRKVDQFVEFCKTESSPKESRKTEPVVPTRASSIKGPSATPTLEEVEKKIVELTRQFDNPRADFDKLIEEIQELNKLKDDLEKARSSRKPEFGGEYLSRQMDQLSLGERKGSSVRSGATLDAPPKPFKFGSGDVASVSSKSSGSTVRPGSTYGAPPSSGNDGQLAFTFQRDTESIRSRTSSGREKPAFNFGSGFDLPPVDESNLMETMSDRLRREGGMSGSAGNSGFSSFRPDEETSSQRIARELANQRGPREPSYESDRRSERSSQRSKVEPGRVPSPTKSRSSTASAAPTRQSIIGKGLKHTKVFEKTMMKSDGQYTYGDEGYISYRLAVGDFIDRYKRIDDGPLYEEWRRLYKNFMDKLDDVKRFGGSFAAALFLDEFLKTYDIVQEFVDYNQPPVDSIRAINREFEAYYLDFKNTYLQRNCVSNLKRFVNLDNYS